MRTALIALLLAFAAGPAAAQVPPHGGSNEAPEDSDANSGADSDSDADADSDASTGPPPTPPASERGDLAPSVEAHSDADSVANTDPDADPTGETDVEPDAAAEAEIAAPAPAPRWTSERAAAWATFAASMGVAVLGGVLLAVGVDDLNSVENAPDGIRWERVAGARDRAPILTGVGAAILGLGAAGLAVSAGLLAYFGADGTWLQVSVGPAAVGVRGRF